VHLWSGFYVPAPEGLLLCCVDLPAGNAGSD